MSDRSSATGQAPAFHHRINALIQLRLGSATALARSKPNGATADQPAATDGGIPGLRRGVEGLLRALQTLAQMLSLGQLAFSQLAIQQRLLACCGSSAARSKLSRRWLFNDAMPRPRAARWCWPREHGGPEAAPRSTGRAPGQSCGSAWVRPWEEPKEVWAAVGRASSRSCGCWTGLLVWVDDASGNDRAESLLHAQSRSFTEASGTMLYQPVVGFGAVGIKTLIIG